MRNGQASNTTPLSELWREQILSVAAAAGIDTDLPAALHWESDIRLAGIQHTRLLWSHAGQKRFMRGLYWEPNAMLPQRLHLGLERLLLLSGTLVDQYETKQPIAEGDIRTYALNRTSHITCPGLLPAIAIQVAQRGSMPLGIPSEQREAWAALLAPFRPVAQS